MGRDEWIVKLVTNGVAEKHANQADPSVRGRSSGDRRVTSWWP